MFEKFIGHKKTEDGAAAPEVIEALQEKIQAIVSESFPSASITTQEISTTAKLVADYFAKQGNPLTEEKVNDPTVQEQVTKALASRINSAPVQTYSVGESGNVLGTNLSTAEQARLAQEDRENHNNSSAS